MRNSGSSGMITQFWPWLWPSLLFFSAVISDLLLFGSSPSCCSLLLALALHASGQGLDQDLLSTREVAQVLGLDLQILEFGQSWALNPGIP